MHTYEDHNGQLILNKTLAMSESEFSKQYEIVDLPEGYKNGQFGGVIKMNLDFLNSAFETAIRNGDRFIGIKVNMGGFEKYEVIINERENFKEKLKYYQRTYNEDLKHKFSQDIRIVDVASGNSFDDIQADLVD